MTAKPGRIPCSIIGCRRTAPAAKYEPGCRIICYKCWRLGKKSDRRLYAKCKRVEKRDPARAPTMASIMNRCWERVLITATERTVGITA